jgi:hypothetical protein
MNDAAEQIQSNDAPGSGVNTEPEDNGQVLDYGEILAQHRAELAQTGKTVQELRAELNRSHGVIGRVQKAFSGDTDERLTPSQQRMREFDELAQYLDQEALENQRGGGKGLPITTKIGKQLATYGKEAEARAERLEQEISELKQAMKRRENPAFQGLERAAFVMEGMVEEALESLYGAEAGAKGIRESQFNAVTARINDEIKDLMKNDPNGLLKVQRNPKVMRKMVNHFLAEMLPPKVRTMLDDERIKNEPILPRELWQAFSEAKEAYQEAESRGDAKTAAQYSALMTDIRHDILSNQISGRRGGTAEKPSLNNLMTGFIGGR